MPENAIAIRTSKPPTLRVSIVVLANALVGLDTERTLVVVML
jgi:hypothetical protein